MKNITALDAVESLYGHGCISTADLLLDVLYRDYGVKDHYQLTEISAVEALDSLHNHCYMRTADRLRDVILRDFGVEL